MIGGLAGLRLCLAHDDVDAVAELQRAAALGGAGGHVGDDFLHLVHRVGPHQIHIGSFGSRFARVFGQAAEIERRALAGNGLHVWRRQLQLVELALVVERVAVEQRLQNLHHLDRAVIAWLGGQHFARHVGRDDVDGEAATQDLIERGDLAGQLRRPGFAHADRHQQADAMGERGDGTGKHLGVDAKLIARWQQDIVEPALFGGHHDIAAMFPAGAQARIGHAEELIVIVAQGGEPADFRATHGKFSPSDATRMAYHSARVNVTLKASAASAMRTGFWLPTIGVIAAGCASTHA